MDMAFSYFGNWDTLKLLETDMIDIQEQHRQDEQTQDFLATDGLFFDIDCESAYLDPIIDQFIKPDELFFSESLTNLHFSSPPQDCLYLEDLESFHFPKRQKRLADHHRDIYNFTPREMKYVHSYPSAPELFSLQVPSDIEKGNVYFNVNLDVKKQNSNRLSRTVSAQSIAARERRRKITEKTQELSKLIPSGQKMNTAEMFQAATKYVKFLQAQIGILQLIRNEKSSEAYSNDEQEKLGVLLGSQEIQDKLASKEKCLVPQKFVRGLVKKDREIEKKPLILDDLDKLLNING